MNQNQCKRSEQNVEQACRARADLIRRLNLGASGILLIGTFLLSVFAIQQTAVWAADTSPTYDLRTYAELTEQGVRMKCRSTPSVPRIQNKSIIGLDGIDSIGVGGSSDISNSIENR